ncbi:MAG: site-specific integrase, partial [Bacteroidetes bacterium]|nr:site-specific integrase [Bacteroidota bacterium]
QRLHTKLAKDSGLYQANRILARISSIFNKAIEWGWDGGNPAQGIKKFKEKSRDRFLRPGELPFFFEALHEEENQTACDYILMSLYTGARKTNVLSMRWTEIDLDRALWRIPETKNGEPLTIALSIEALEILQRRQKQTNRKWVFPSDKTDSHLTDPKNPWKRILTNATIKYWQAHSHIAPLVAQAMQQTKTRSYNRKLYVAVQTLAEEQNIELPTGLMDMRLHDLRRTLGSFQAAAGANQYIIGKSLGHKSHQATAVYARLDLDPVRESVQAASTAISRAGKKKTE